MAGDTSLVQHTLRVTLKGKDNSTYSGTLLIRNWTAVAPPAPEPEEADPLQDDPTGASYYVIAVVLVYGFSIVMLIASHIKRKHAKLVEDRQINKYLQEFQIVKEKSSRDSYRHLKKSIVAKLGKERRPTYRTLSTTLFPVMAVALPPIQEQMDGGGQAGSSERNLLQVPSTDLPPMRPHAASAASMYEYLRRGSKLNAPSLLEINRRARHMSMPYFASSRESSIEREVTHMPSQDSSINDIEIDVPVISTIPRVDSGASSWKNLNVQDSIPELHESAGSEDMVDQIREARDQDRPMSERPHHLSGRPEELRPDRLHLVAEEAMSHRVQTHPTPPSPSVRRTGTAPLARVYPSSSLRAKAHMAMGGYPRNGPAVSKYDSKDSSDSSGIAGVHATRRMSPPRPHHPESSHPTEGPRQSAPRASRSRSPPRQRGQSTGTSEKTPSPCLSDSSDDSEQESVWLLIENGQDSSPQSAEFPVGLSYLPPGGGSRGSVSPLIRSSRDTSPMNSREPSQSRSTTPSRLSTPSRSSSMQRRSSSPRPGQRGPHAYSGPGDGGDFSSPSPRPSPKSARASPSPVSSETEHLLHVTVL